MAYLRLLLLAATLSAGFSLAGLPSAVLFGSLVAGAAIALTGSTASADDESRPALRVPGWLFRIAQGLIGVVIGASVSLEALRRIGQDGVPIVAVMVVTVALSIGSGRLLALRHDVSPVTGIFALVAGGASGVVAVARDLGADERIVTVVQYLRVLVVLLTLPLVTTVVFHPARGQGTLANHHEALWRDLVFVAVSLAVGLLVASRIPVPTAALLAPLLVAVALAVSHVLGTPAVPTPLQWLAYGLIGVQVGLRFTRDSLASIARMLPAVLGLVVGIVVLTALTGALLAWLTPVDGLTAYLATTPGGLFAVLAVAADSGSDVTYVTAVQLCRLLVVLALTPLLARWFTRPGAAPGR